MANVTCTSEQERAAAVVQAAVQHSDAAAALTAAAACACRLYGLGRVYFTRAYGRRRHYLAGAGEENFQPLMELNLGQDLWAFLEGGEALPDAARAALATALRTVARRYGGAAEVE